MFRQIKLSQLESALKNANSYQEYYEAALSIDELTGANEWKAKEISSKYDYRLIKKRLARMKQAKEDGDAYALMSILHEGIHGNLGNISNPKLRRESLIGTKYLIEEFINSVCDALHTIYHASEDQIDFYEKLSFFDETSHAYGQSCLMLSGGAGLGFFPSGVIQSLLEFDLIPNVLSGASAGSIIAGLVGTRTNEELSEILSAEWICEKFSQWRVWKGFNQTGMLDPTNLENVLIDLFGLTTFEEAYHKTNRHITVTVSPADLHQYSRLLNAKTSPRAVITQAVRASCALPYVFEPVQLSAKTPSGDIVPYIVTRKFADGSLMADMPFRRLARLYGVNHSIVSQTNPLAAPFLSRYVSENHSLTSITMKHLVNMAKSNSVYACDVLESVIPNSSAKLGVHKVRSIIDQKYVGDITILPEKKLANLKYIASNPTVKGVQALIDEAERATWSQINQIDRSTKISRTFNKYLRLLKQRESQYLTGQPTDLNLVSAS
jgi:TAG lipase / steryl ester hydrolase / phospholipase A2 / LPA acyltransferase